MWKLRHLNKFPHNLHNNTKTGPSLSLIVPWSKCSVARLIIHSVKRRTYFESNFAHPETVDLRSNCLGRYFPMKINNSQSQPNLRSSPKHWYVDKELTDAETWDVIEKHCRGRMHFPKEPDLELTRQHQNWRRFFLFTRILTLVHFDMSINKQRSVYIVTGIVWKLNLRCTF